MTLSNRWNRTIYRLYAPIYDWIAKPFERGRRRAIDRLDPGPDDRILIVGCGTGLDLDHLPNEASITAIDLVSANARRTVARGDALGRDVDVHIGNAQNLPYEDDTFDVVLLHLVLSVVPDPDAVVEETARVLAPDGRVSVFDKFVPDDEKPSFVRRTANPVARIMFSDLTHRLEPMVADTCLVIETREWILRDLYTVAIARPRTEKRSSVE